MKVVWLWALKQCYRGGLYSGRFSRLQRRAGGCRCFAFGAPCRNRGIIGCRLGAEFVQKILLGLLCRLLPVREAWFLESTH